LRSEARVLLAQGEYGDQVRQGERAEFASENFATAVGFYRQALEVTQHPLQAVYARHLLARTLNKDGQNLRLDPAYLQPGSIQVHGLFSMHNATLTSAGDALEMHSMNVTNSVIANTQLIVDGDAASTVTLNNSTFMSFAADAVQFAIWHPGGVFSFDSNSFWGLQAGDMGYFLVAEDTDSGDDVPLQILIGTDPGNGEDFTSTTGAVDTWVP
jgi:hypothetical protein